MNFLSVLNQPEPEIDLGEEPENEQVPDIQYNEKELQQINYYRRLLLEPESATKNSNNNKMQLLDETQEYLGDYIIVLQNPDHSNFKFYKTSITLEDIIHDFINCFSIDSSLLELDIQTNLIFVAFQQAFLKLTDASSLNEPLERVKNDILKHKLKRKRFVFLPDPDQQFNKVATSTSKIYGQGQFLRYNKEVENWERTGQPVQDYQTLLRQLILIKLSFLAGFYVRQFISSDGENIFLVLYQDANNIAQEAMRVGIPKELNFALTDLLSLEPVDKRYRPLRLLSIFANTKTKQQEFIEEKIKRGKVSKKQEKINTLITKIKQLLLDINYKKICKELEIPPYENIQPIKEEDFKQNLKLLSCYHEYLVILNTRITSLRMKYQDLSDENLIPESERLVLQNQLYKNGIFKNSSLKKYVRKQHETKILKNQINPKLVRATNIRIMAGEYQKIFKLALNQVNRKFGKNLFNIWDYSGMRPLSAHYQFFTPKLNQSYKAYARQFQIWQRYVINSNGQEELFLKMHRNKVCISILEQIFDIHRMNHECEYIELHFIPNDLFDLEGKNMKKFLRHLFKAEANKPELLFQHLKQSNNYVQVKKDRKISVAQASKKTKKLITSIISMKKSKKKKIRGGLYSQNLANVWNIYNIPIKHISAYYGERVALYFYFLQYCTLQFIPIGMIAIPIFFLELLLEESSIYYRLCMILYCLFIIFWSSLFSSRWNEQEINFGVTYGFASSEESDTKLVGFEGTSKRSLLDDNMNDPFCNERSIWVKFAFSLIGISFFIIAEVCIIIGLFFLMSDFAQKEYFPKIDFIPLEIVIPVCIWMIISLFFDDIFKPFAYKFTKWENHKYLKTFESSYMIKILLFSTVNRMGQPFFIAFINSQFWGCTNGCYNQLQIYMRASFMIQFGKNLIFKFFIPFSRFFVYQAKRQIEKIFLDDQKTEYRKSPFYEVNFYFQSECTKQNFQQRPEIDGTFDQYIDQVLQFGLLTNYGIPFPLVYIAAFFTNLVQLQIDKISLLKFKKKPPPLGAKSLSSFKHYMQIMTYGSIFTNSGIMTVTIPNLFAGQRPMMIFILLVFGFYLFKLLIDLIFSGANEKINNIKLRHNYITEKIATVKVKKTSGQSQKTFPILKPFGTILSKKKVQQKVNEKGNQLKSKNLNEDLEANIKQISQQSIKSLKSIKSFQLNKEEKSQLIENQQ